MNAGFLGNEGLTSGDVKVGWGDGRMASGEAILSTQGLACCIGIAIYDPITTYGYLAHVFSYEESHAKVAVPMVETAVSHASERSRLLAWVRGGTVDTRPDSPRYELELGLREKTVNLLSSVGIVAPRLDLEWNNNPSQLVEMSLFCSSGTVISVSPYRRLQRLPVLENHSIINKKNDGLNYENTINRDIKPKLSKVERQSLYSSSGPLHYSHKT